MLNLRIVKSPLEAFEYHTILGAYNRLTSSRIPFDEFVHWLQNSPAGPACHAILETDDGEIVGHHSLIPFRANCNGSRIVPAKSEYSFLREEFRARKVRGFENSLKPTWLILVAQHFQRCKADGWGPFLISTNPVLYRLGPGIGCQAKDFPLWECMLVLRPWNSARKTPNLSRWQRTLLYFAGVIQGVGWSLILSFAPRSSGIQTCPIGDYASPKANHSLSFFEDQDSLRWRFLEGQYECLALDEKEHECVIVKKGSADRYIRVCQWRLGPGQPTFSLLARLVRMAQEQKALGVRWAVYGDDEATAKIVRRMRRLGFLCARRVRNLLVYTNDREIGAAEKWDLTDTMFSFDP